MSDVKEYIVKGKKWVVFGDSANSIKSISNIPYMIIYPNSISYHHYFKNHIYSFGNVQTLFKDLGGKGFTAIFATPYLTYYSKTCLLKDIL